MGDRSPASARAYKIIKLPLGGPQVFIPASCDAFIDRIILKHWACLSIGASCSIALKEI